MEKRKKLVEILKVISTIIGALIAFFGGNAAAMLLQELQKIQIKVTYQNKSLGIEMRMVILYLIK